MRDAAELARREATIPAALHRRIFGDVYDWQARSAPPDELISELENSNT